MSKNTTKILAKHSEGTLRVPGDIRNNIGSNIHATFSGELDISSGAFIEHPDLVIMDKVGSYLSDGRIQELKELLLNEVISSIDGLMDPLSEEDLAEDTDILDFCHELLYNHVEDVINRYLEPFNDRDAEGITYVDEVEDEIIEDIIDLIWPHIEKVLATILVLTDILPEDTPNEVFFGLVNGILSKEAER